MACDFDALSSIDSAGDPEEAMRLLQECTQTLADPRLWLWAIGLTIVCGAVGAWIGRRRGTMMRDAVLGAALGPIGWIVSAFLPAPKPKAKPSVCPGCGRLVDAGDRHCRNCGRLLAAPRA